MQDFTSYYDNDDGSEHDDHDGDDFYSFYEQIMQFMVDGGSNLLKMIYKG